MCLTGQLGLDDQSGVTYQCVAVNVLLPLLLRRHGIIDRRFTLAQQLDCYHILLGELGC
jgi:hypothetical protein